MRLCAAAFFVCAAAAPAQTVSATGGTTPAILAPGDPLSSYPLSGIDNYSPFTGIPNIQIPLHHIGGRNSAGYDMRLRLSNTWVASTDPTLDTTDPNYPYHVSTAFGSWALWDPGYGPGTLFARSVSQPGAGCPISGDQAQYTLTRITFTGADGTETELRDTNTDGKPYTVPNYCTTSASSWDAGRGTVFASRDGSAVTFVSDAAVLDYPQNASPGVVTPMSGALHFRDGTTYRFDSGTVTWIRDRNGNKISFVYDTQNRVTSITDQNNRITTVVYGSSTCQASAPSCDIVTYPGFNSSERTVEIDFGDLSQNLRSDYCAPATVDKTTCLRSYATLFPQTVSAGSPGTSLFDFAAGPSYVRYNDGSYFQFQYNTYGETARIQLPTGGAIEYDIDGFNGSGSDGLYALGANAIVDRVLVARREYSNGTNLSGSRAYTYTFSVAGAAPPQTTTTETVEDSAGTARARTIHSYSGSPYTAFIYSNGLGYNDWHTGLETQTQSGLTATLRTAVYTWAQASAVAWCSSTAGTPTYCDTSNGPYENNPPSNPGRTGVTTTLETNQVSQVTMGYDQYNNVMSKSESDYGTGSSGAVKRQTITNYKTDASYVNPNVNLVSLPADETIEDGGGTQFAKTTWAYDEGSLQSETGIVGLDQSVGPRGNVTTLSRILNGSSLSDTMVYDVAGNITDRKDALLNETVITWGGPNNTFASPVSVTNPLNQNTTYQYDYNTGKTIQSVDPNLVTTYYDYSDPLDRLKTVRAAAGDATTACLGPAETETTYSYPSFTSTVTTRDRVTCGDHVLSSTVLYDGFGRTRSQQQATPDGTIQTDTTYDFMGRTWQVSNPHLSSDTAHYTTYAYDELSRTSSQTSDDSAQTMFSYSGNTSTVIDPASVSRTTTSDALGRLTGVTDATGSTSYSYDPLDNLLQVTQGTQTRTFAYDALKRLTCASNPERRVGAASCLSSPPATSGVDLYSYDKTGNLTGHSDARGTTATMLYDRLARAIRKSYTDGTPTVSYCYDGSTTATSQDGNTVVTCTGATALTGIYAKGRLTWESNTNSSTAYTLFDAFGRVKNSAQMTSGGTGSPYLFSYAYDRAGGLASETYPSQRVVTTTYDSAERPTTVAAGGTTYVSGVQYAAHGPVRSAAYGSGLTDTWTFDPVRLQPLELKTTAADQSVKLDLKYWYCAGQAPNGWAPCTTNNGNVEAAGIAATGGLSVTQNFSYDTTGRLWSAQENGGSNWSQTYSYDIWGNRAVSGTIWNPMSTPTDLSKYTNNQWIRGAGDQYDPAGNQTGLASNNAVGVAANLSQYDAENRMTGANIGNTGWVSYLYDGEGRRVQKTVGTTVTTYVYDAAGQLAGEYLTGGSTAAGTQYPTADALGSTRMVANGAAIQLYDYLPFGEDIPQGVGSRGAQYPTGMYPGTPDTLATKFTGKERDAETGLDYFGARYMSSAQGRFTSPDPLGNFVADLRNPQSWNLYSYVWNNPLVNIDPTGLTCVSVSHPDGSTGQADDGDGKGCSDAGVAASPIKHGLKDDKPVVTSKDITPQQANVYGGPNAAAQEVREIVGQFLTGTAPKQVVYGPDDPFTQSFKQSAGMDAIVGGIKGSCKTQGRVFVGSGEAFVNTLIDGILGGQGFGTPEAQLGAFDSSFTRSGGQVNIQVYNPISLNSLAYHATAPIGVRNPASGPLSTVNQTLQLSIADPCR